jgi:subtilisin family serine protease
MLNFIAQGVLGVAPGTPVVSLKVLNDKQPGLLSSMLAAAQWLLSDGVKLGIRVVNISLAAFAAPGSKVGDV